MSYPSIINLFFREWRGLSGRFSWFVFDVYIHELAWKDVESFTGKTVDDLHDTGVHSFRAIAR